VYSGGGGGPMCGTFVGDPYNAMWGTLAMWGDLCGETLAMWGTHIGDPCGDPCGGPLWGTLVGGPLWGDLFLGDPCGHVTLVKPEIT
jgi:hypothetical protein